MGGASAKRKGASGEREWAQFLKEHGYEAWRGRQYHGGTDSPDVVCPSLAQFHFEVKRVEKLRIEPAMRQARGDATDQVPVVAYRSNREPWLVILDAKHFMELVHGCLRTSVPVSGLETETQGDPAAAGVTRPVKAGDNPSVD